MTPASPMWREAGILAAVLFLVAFAISGIRPLSVPDEGRYPEVAREMVQRGDYITPHLNGVVFLDKPALYYWLEAASFKLLGINHWAIRLPGVLTGVAGMVLVFVASWQLFSPRAARLAAAALICNPLYFLAGQYANMDLEVAIWVTATLLLFLLARIAPDKSWQQRLLFWGAYACMGCGVLTKGLIGAVFPLMIIGVWTIVGWRWCELLRWQVVSGILITLAVCLPWYVAVQKANPGFFHYFFIYQQFERFSSGGFNNALPFWFYLPILFLFMLPWSPWLGHALYNQVRGSFGTATLPRADVRQLLVLWPTLVFIFFSIPQSKIVGYILPVVPPLAMLLGDYLDRKLVQAGDHPGFFLRHLRATAIAGGLLTLIILVLLMLAPHIEVLEQRINQDDVHKLAAQFKALQQPGDIVVNYRTYNQDLPVYLDAAEPIRIVEDWNNAEVMAEDNWHHDLAFGLANNPEARRWLISEQDFLQLLHSTPHIYVVANHHEESVLNSYYHFNTLVRTKNHVLMVSTDASHAVSPDVVRAVQAEFESRLARKRPQPAAEKRDHGDQQQHNAQ